MTGSIVGRAFDSNRRAITKPDRFELLPYVAHPRAEVTRACRVFFILSQQVSVRGEHRAAATGVRYDGLTTLAKSIDVLSRQDACAIELAGMRMQGAATDLACRRLRLTSICFQHSRRGRINSLKQTFGNAGFEEQRRRSSRLFWPERGHPARISNARRTRRAVQQSQPKLKFRRDLARQSNMQ